jgi:hypothetical protein
MSQEVWILSSISLRNDSDPCRLTSCLFGDNPEIDRNSALLDGSQSPYSRTHKPVKLKHHGLVFSLLVSPVFIYRCWTGNLIFRVLSLFFCRLSRFRLGVSTFCRAPFRLSSPSTIEKTYQKGESAWPIIRHQLTSWSFTVTMLTPW